jgi:Arc/MetJ family transcription regulator
VAIEIDDKLIMEAQKIGRFKTKKETINKVLAEYIQRHQQMEIIKQFGEIEYEEDYNYKTGRKRK